MADSFQNEIPKARVNIALDVETREGRKKKELPLKLLVMGDFSHGKTQGPIAERERLNIDKSNFDQVMENLAPELSLVVDNKVKRDGSSMRVNLKFDAIKKFHPQEIIKQIPELSNLMAMRNLLKDLKSNVLDNNSFRKELEKIIKDEAEMKKLRGQLNQLMSSNDSGAP